jgi:hypothetical protein
MPASASASLNDCRNSKCVFGINEIRDLIDTCADHRNKVNYVTLALSGPKSSVRLLKLNVRC